MGEAPEAPKRVRDGVRTRGEILDVAAAEFAAYGYNGAKVDKIADLTRTTKRMIYYHFGSKKELYIAVLERAYLRIRAAEQHVNVDNLDPVTAVRRIAEVTFDHHEANPDFIRLVSIENVHYAEHVKELVTMVDLGTPVIRLLDDLLERGRLEGVFHADADAIDMHMMISAFCCFRMTNRHTFGAIFGRDLVDPARHDHYRTMCGDMIVRYLMADTASAESSRESAAGATPPNGRHKDQVRPPGPRSDNRSRVRTGK